MLVRYRDRGRPGVLGTKSTWASWAVGRSVGQMPIFKYPAMRRPVRRQRHPLAPQDQFPIDLGLESGQAFGTQLGTWADESVETDYLTLADYQTDVAQMTG